MIGDRGYQIVGDVGCWRVIFAGVDVAPGVTFETVGAAILDIGRRKAADEERRQQ